MNTRLSSLSASILNLFLGLALIAPVLAPHFARAQTTIEVTEVPKKKVLVKKSSSTTTITTINKEVESEDENDALDGTTSVVIGNQLVEPEPIEREMRADFGSTGQTGMAGCKTEELSKNMVRELKTDCNAWIKDQKADLQSKYLTGSCTESCEPCGMSLKRCSVVGRIKYTTKTAK